MILKIEIGLTVHELEIKTKAKGNIQVMIHTTSTEEPNASLTFATTNMMIRLADFTL